jgi:hypothetical protein
VRVAVASAEKRLLTVTPGHTIKNLHWAWYPELDADLDGNFLPQIVARSLQEPEHIIITAAVGPSNAAAYKRVIDERRVKIDFDDGTPPVSPSSVDLANSVPLLRMDHHYQTFGRKRITVSFGDPLLRSLFLDLCVSRFEMANEVDQLVIKEGKQYRVIEGVCGGFSMARDFPSLRFNKNGAAFAPAAGYPPYPFNRDHSAVHVVRSTPSRGN